MSALSLGLIFLVFVVNRGLTAGISQVSTLSNLALSYLCIAKHVFNSMSSTGTKKGERWHSYLPGFFWSLSFKEAQIFYRRMIALLLTLIFLSASLLDMENDITISYSDLYGHLSSIHASCPQQVLSFLLSSLHSIWEWQHNLLFWSLYKFVHHIASDMVSKALFKTSLSGNGEQGLILLSTETSQHFLHLRWSYCTTNQDPT